LALRPINMPTQVCVNIGLIDPKDRKVIVYQFAQEEGEDTVSIYGFQDKIPVGIYHGALEIDFAKIAKRLGGDYQ